MLAREISHRDLGRLEADRFWDIQGSGDGPRWVERPGHGEKTQGGVEDDCSRGGESEDGWVLYFGLSLHVSIPLHAASEFSLMGS